MKTLAKTSVILLMCLLAHPAYSAVSQATANALQEVVSAYRSTLGVTGFRKLTVKDIKTDRRQRTVTIELNEAATDLPLTAESLSRLKADMLQVLGRQYSNYNVILTCGGNSLDSLLPFAPKKNIGPSEKIPFISEAGKPAAPSGLDGANIAVWQSHGWYFEPKLNRWEWQRARIFQTVEDLYTQSYVMPYLMPMLENAGAYVISPRERDTSRFEAIVDNDGALATGTYAESGPWGSDINGFAHVKAELHNGDNPFREGTVRKAPLSGSDNPTSVATWSADIPHKGDYAVYVSYKTLENSTPAAKYTVHAADGDHHFTVNQRMGGGTWIYLGHFPLNSGKSEIVELSNAGDNRRTVVTADAVKIGGGMGNVARIVKEPVDSIDYKYVLSGYPRFTEGARYFMQWAGAPDSVFTPSDYVNDYTDDYRSRGLWVNWLAGGSSMLPDREGLNIPIDLSFAFHSDAGTTMNDSIIGSLGIYCTQGDTLANGTSRMAARDLTNLVISQITEDVRNRFEPNWTRRGMWDQSYYEARVPQVPAMLLELLSHQNFADMSYGLDPEFRFTVSRAIYKGMLKFLAGRDGRDYVVQPLAVHAFAISKEGDNKYRLSWKATEDAGEPTAVPTYYIIEERIGDGVFRTVARSEEPHYDVTVTDSDIHSYRITAANDGGVSFPSEILALANLPGEPVTVVNGFTRVSAPDRFDSGEIAGFYDARDHGVPYMKDISFIGSQFEYRRNIPWMDDDAAGFGASRADYEDKVIAGNTFDYAYVHGAAIAAAGRPFISTSIEAFIESTDTPAVVDIILGKQKEIIRGRGAYGTVYKAFTAPLQARMRELAAKGTAFFVSGSYIATDIWDNPYSIPEVAEADKAFAREVLGFNWRVGQASATGQAYQVDNRYKDFTGGEYAFHNTLNPDFYAVESPDSFYPADDTKCAVIMRYSENNLIAGTAYAGTHRTVALGFPFETVRDVASRTYLMKQILTFFADPEPVRSHSSHEY